MGEAEERIRAGERHLSIKYFLDRELKFPVADSIEIVR